MGYVNCSAGLCIFVVAPTLAIVAMYFGFNTQNAYSFYFGSILKGKDWTRATVPIALFLTAGFLSMIVPGLLVFGVVKKNRRIVFSYLALLGTVVAIEVAAWIFLSEHKMSGSVGHVMDSSLEAYYSRNQSVRDISVQFWDNLQINLQCCGIQGPADWTDTAGFVPNSCCLFHFRSVEHCTDRVKTEDDNPNLIYTEGCLNEFNRYYSIDYLGYLTIPMVVLQLFGVYFACFFLINAYRYSYENL